MRISATSFALGLKNEAMMWRISRSSSIIRWQGYRVSTSRLAESNFRYTQDRAVWILLRKRRRCGHKQRYGGKEQAEKTEHDVLPNCGRPHCRPASSVADISQFLDAISHFGPGRQGPRSAVLSSSIAHPNWSLLPKSLNLLAVSKRYGRPDSWFESRSLRHELGICPVSCF